MLSDGSSNWLEGAMLLAAYLEIFIPTLEYEDFGPYSSALRPLSHRSCSKYRIVQVHHVARERKVHILPPTNMFRARYNM